MFGLVDSRNFVWLHAVNWFPSHSSSCSLARLLRLEALNRPFVPAFRSRLSRRYGVTEAMETTVE